METHDSGGGNSFLMDMRKFGGRGAKSLHLRLPGEL